jgi:Bardet-Biedl syndrome 7 protein
MFSPEIGETYMFLSVRRQMGPQSQWVLEREGHYGTIQCLDNYDITGDGVRELIVGRHDGNIEVYAFEEGEDAEPELRFSHVSWTMD